MSIKNLQAIDVHGHYGDYYRDGSDLVNRFMSGDAETVLARAKMTNTCLTLVSPLKALLPRYKANPVAGNDQAVDVVAKNPGLRQWVVIDPLHSETYEQADRILRLPTCVGIKIHPEEHGYPIKEHGRQIFEFAAERESIILTHSGENNSLPEDMVPFANDFPQARLILAHIGCSEDDDPGHQVRAVQASRHGNIYADTSSASSIVSGLIEWAVREIGAEKILFGTDTPLYFSPMQRERINHADISEKDKQLILRDNAIALFNFEI